MTDRPRVGWTTAEYDASPDMADRLHGRILDLEAERDRYRAALESIRDHGTANGHKCWALHQGDCADVFQETARAALDA